MINGVVAVPAMAAMMWIAGGRDQMGHFTATPAVLVFGWAATAVIKGATDNLGSRTV